MLGGAAPLRGVDELQAAAFVECARVVGDMAEAGVEVVGEADRAGDPFRQGLEDPDAQGVGQGFNQALVDHFRPSSFHWGLLEWGGLYLCAPLLVENLLII